MEEHTTKKAIIINGSPKRNRSVTMRVTQAFTQGLCKSVPIETEVITVADLDITPCRGCLSCWSRTEGHCVIENDDMKEVRRKLDAADYIIMSFPLYFFGMPGMLKVFTDRLLSMLKTYVGQPPVLSDKSMHGIRVERPNIKFVMISSCAYTDTKVVYDSLIAQFDCICGKGKYTPIFCPQLQTMIDSGEGARLDRYLKKFENAGEVYGRDGRLDDENLKELSRPPFSDATYRKLLAMFWEKMKGGKLDV